MFFYNSNHGRVDHNHTCIPSLYAYQTRGPPVGCGVCLCGGRPVEKIFMPVPDFGYFTWGKGPMLWDLKYYIKKAFQPCCCCFFFCFYFSFFINSSFSQPRLGVFNHYSCSSRLCYEGAWRITPLRLKMNPPRPSAPILLGCFLLSEFCPQAAGIESLEKTVTLYCTLPLAVSRVLMLS